MIDRVTVWPLDAKTENDVVEFAGADFDYLSFVNHGTFGKPALITKGANDYVEGEVAVLYLNPGAALAIKVEKS